MQNKRITLVRFQTLLALILLLNFLATTRVAYAQNAVIREITPPRKKTYPAKNLTPKPNTVLPAPRKKENPTPNSPAPRQPIFYPYLSDVPAKYRLAAAHALETHVQIRANTDRLPEAIPPATLKDKHITLFRSQGALFLASRNTVTVLHSGPFPRHNTDPLFDTEAEIVVDAALSPDRTHVILLTGFNTVSYDCDGVEEDYQLRILRLRDGKFTDFRNRFFGIPLANAPQRHLAWVNTDRIALTNGIQTAWYNRSGGKVTVTKGEIPR